MSRDFLASQLGREFKPSPNRDRTVRGGWQAIYASIYKVEITTTSPSVFYYYDLGNQTYQKTVEAVEVLRTIPYPSTPGTKSRFVDLRDNSATDTFTSASPILIAGAGAFFIEQFPAYTIFEARRGRTRVFQNGAFTYLIGSSYYVSKIKIVFNVQTFSPFCISNTDQYYENGPLVPLLTSHNQQCFRSRWTYDLGADSEPADMYAFTPSARSIEFGPRVVPYIDVPAIAREQLESFTISGQPTDNAVFSTWRKTAGIFYDSAGNRRTLKNPVLGLNDPQIATCCDLS